MAANYDHRSLHSELKDKNVDLDYEYSGLMSAGDEGIIISEKEIDVELDGVTDLYPLGVIDKDDNVYRIHDDASHLFDEEEYTIEEGEDLELGLGFGIVIEDL